MALYNKKVAALITGEKNEELLDFYIKGIIKQIEHQIGYELTKKEITEFVKGVDTNVVYLKRKPVEQVSKVLWGNEELPYRVDEHRVILDMEICKSEELQITYIAGYDELPEDIQSFIFNTLKEMRTNVAGLKSYSIQDISYSYTDKSQQAENFRAGIKNLFGVRV